MNKYYSQMQKVFLLWGWSALLEISSLEMGLESEMEVWDVGVNGIIVEAEINFCNSSLFCWCLVAGDGGVL